MYEYIHKPLQNRQKPIIQMKYPFLKTETIAAGTTLYHGTATLTGVNSILEGVDFDINAKGNSNQLGKGFYTCGSIDEAKVSGGDYVLQICTTGEMEGQRADYTINNNFICPNKFKKIIESNNNDINEVEAVLGEDDGLINNGWTGMLEGSEETLDAGNDFIKTEASYIEGTKFQTWLNQVKLTKQSEGKFIVYPNIITDDSDDACGCCGVQ